MKLSRVNNLTPAFPSVLDRLFEGNLFDLNPMYTSGVHPLVNVKESSDEFMLEVAAPGLKKEHFKLEYDNGSLRISAEQEGSENKVDGYIKKEFSFAKFERTFSVSMEVIDSDKISAKYEDGVLYVSLPKREEVKPKPAKEIAIL